MAAKKLTVDYRLDELARIRARFLALEREVDEAGRAPITRTETEARIDEVIAALAAQAKPELLGVNLISPSRRGSTAGAGTTAALLGSGDGGPDHARMIPAGAIAAAVMPDALKTWLLDAAAAAAEDFPPAISTEERQQRLELLASERRDLECDEASACWAIEALGQQAAWRGDMNPALVLGLEN